MKKIMRLIVLVVAVTIFVSAQSSVKAQAFQNGDMVANIGAGFGWYSYAYGATSLPALSLSIEKGIKDLENIGPLSIGGIVGFKHASYPSFYYDYTWNDIIVAARGAIHYDLLKNEKVDTYGGVALGLRIRSHTDYFLENKMLTSIHPLFAFYLGGRYYLTDNLAAFGELGYGLGYLTIGISYKF